jgi:SAM-dependent methyltransferase
VSIENYHAVHLPPDSIRQVVWEVITSYLEPFLPPAGAIMELGAGYCHWVNTAKATRKVAIDAWEDFPRYAGHDVECLIQDLRLPVSRNFQEQFDVVLASNLLEHLFHDEIDRLLEQVHCWLKHGGALVLMQPNFYLAYRNYFDDYTHRTIFTHVSLSTLLRTKGFEMVRVEPRFMPYSLKNSRAPKWRWLMELYLHLPFRPFAGQMLLIGKKG